MNHLPLNHILSFLDAGQTQRAAMEAAKVVGTHVPEAADFCVYSKGIHAGDLNDALWSLYTTPQPYPHLVKTLGRVIWPGHSLFN